MPRLAGEGNRLVVFLLLIVLAVALGNLIYNLQNLPLREEGTGGGGEGTGPTGPVVEAGTARSFLRVAYLAFMVSALISMALYLVLVRRRRKKIKSPPPYVFRNNNFLMAIVVMFAGFLLLIFLRGGGLLDLQLFEGEEGGTGGSGDSGDVAPPSTGGVSPTFPVGLIILVVAVAVLLALNYARRGRRVGPGQAEGTRRMVAAEMRKALYSLEEGEDPRSVIMRCYRRTCQLLTHRGVADSEVTTPREFEAGAGFVLGLTEESLHRLTRLFEVARYSHHPVGPAERDEAVVCLRSIQEELEA